MLIAIVYSCLIVSAFFHSCVSWETNCDEKQRILSGHFRFGDWSRLPTEHLTTLRYRIQSNVYAVSEQGPSCYQSAHNIGLSYYWSSPTRVQRILARHLDHTLHKNTIGISSPAQLCHLISGRNILIVGDSINFQFYASLIQFLWNKKDTNISTTVDSQYRKFSHGHSTIIHCNENSHSFAIHFIRNYGLWLNTKDDSTDGMYYYPWVNEISKRNISILILNRGAHYTPNHILLNDLNNTFHYLNENVIHNVTVIWRDTPHGHAGCKANFKDPPMDKDHVIPVAVLPLRHWEEFHLQNRLVENLLKLHYSWIYYMHVYTMTVRRADSHKLKPDRGLYFIL